MPLFWTQFCGAFNDNFLKNALVILVTYRSATVLGLPYTEIVAVAGALFILPFFLFSGLAGQLADKYEKTKIVFFVKIAEILIMFLATYGLMTEKFGFLLGVLFLMGLHSTFFGPVKYSVLPQHLHPHEMVGGNALVEAGTFLAILLGTMGGGFLIALERGPEVVSIGLLAIALFGFIVSLWIPKAPPVDPNLPVTVNPLTSSLKMLAVMRENPRVLNAGLGISWFWLFGAVILSVFPALCKDVLNASEQVPPLFLAMFSVGIAVGSILCDRLSKHKVELGLVTVGSIGLSLFTGVLYWLCEGFNGGTAGPLDAKAFALAPQGFWVLAALFLLSFFGGLYTVPLYTLLQVESAPRVRSRVIAANNILNALFMVIGSLALIVLFRLDLTIPEILLVLAGLNLAFMAGLIRREPEFKNRLKFLLKLG